MAAHKCAGRAGGTDGGRPGGLKVEGLDHGKEFWATLLIVVAGTTVTIGGADRQGCVPRPGHRRRRIPPGRHVREWYNSRASPPPAPGPRGDGSASSPSPCLCPIRSNREHWCRPRG